MDSVFLLTTEFSHCHHMMFNMSQTENFILLLVPLPFFFDLVKFFLLFSLSLRFHFSPSNLCFYFQKVFIYHVHCKLL